MSIAENYFLLALTDFDPNNYKDLHLPKKGLRYPDVSTLIPINKGEVFEIVETGKVDWWIKARKVFPNVESSFEALVPSSLFVPINHYQDMNFENITEGDKEILFPEIDESKVKYFPLFTDFYQTFVTLRKNPINQSSFISRIFYSWLWSYISLGFRRYLVLGDLWTPTSSKKTTRRKASFLQSFAPVEGTKSPLFTRFLFHNKAKFCMAIVCKFFQDILKFLSPFLIRIFIQYAEDKDRKIWFGILLCMILFFSRSLECLLLNKYFEYVNLLGIDFRCLLSSLVFEKIFTARSDCLRKYPQSFQTNLVSVDSYRVQEGVIFMIMIGSCILQIILCFLYLYFILGLAFLSGIGVIIVFIPVNIVFARMSKSIEVQQMKLKDDRINLITSVIDGIRMVKMYSWEKPFHILISKIRRNELIQLSKLKGLFSVIESCLMIVPSLITLVIFFTFIHLHESIGASVAFESMAIFSILRLPLSFLPDSLKTVFFARVSYARIQEYIAFHDKPFQKNYQVSHKIDYQASVTVSNASFKIGDEAEPYIQDINMKISSRGLHIIVGENGSGKTKLLESLLNETILVSGEVKICGKICYVPQSPWIKNESLRKNILDGYPFEASKYDEIVTLCELGRDFKKFKNGDQEDAGEKGVNLSGGQKQRISLARALYSNSDIYLLDDPLSAVDRRVCKRLFQRIFSKEGYLKSKLQVFITHDDQFLPYADCIYLMRDGTISNSGTFDELLEKDSYFETFTPQVKLEGYNFSGKYSIKKQVSIDSVMSFHGDEEDAEGPTILEDDVIMKGHVKKNIYGQYIMSQSLVMFILFLTFIIFYFCNNLIGNILIAKYTAGKIHKNNSSEFFVLYSLTTVGQCLSVLIFSAFQITGIYMASGSVHSKLLSNLLNSSITYHQATPIGRILVAFTAEMSVIDANLPRSIKVFMFLFFTIFISIVGISIFIPYLLLGIAILVAIYLLIQTFYIKSSRQIQRLESLSRAPIVSLLVDVLNGLFIIKSNNKHIEYIKKFDELIDNNSVPGKMNIYCQRWLGVRLELLGNILVLSVALSIIIKAAIGGISSGIVGLLLFISTSIAQSASYLIKYFCEVENNIISLERISNFYNSKKEIDNKSLASLNSTWPENGKITFTNYSCKYQHTLPNVLTDIDFKIEPKQKATIFLIPGCGGGKIGMRKIISDIKSFQDD
ncbi:Multidrug resistance-associated protein 1 [Thelohanellus kitauei]|uniref:Multidrug resistance-associated protein 1 n=1 Tax=Thelohanellus kitauei TaxID=669202 RepID=A0A0C2IDI0_THEKT|nr:Multidrug resistance-associated protein 1 [Thelohanellus kitauei]